MGRCVRLWSSIWPSTICSPDIGEKRYGEGAGTWKHTWRKNPSSSGTNSVTLAEKDQLGRRGQEQTAPDSLDSPAFQLQEHTPFPCHCLGFIRLPSCEPTGFPLPFLLTWIQPPRMLVVSFR